MIMRLTEPDGYVRAPFTLQLGTRVRSRLNSNDVGEVVEGVFEGPESAGAFKILYIVREDDGTEFAADELSLQPI